LDLTGAIGLEPAGWQYNWLNTPVNIEAATGTAHLLDIITKRLSFADNVTYFENVKSTISRYADVYY
jgi:hypothetical protein